MKKNILFLTAVAVSLFSCTKEIDVQTKPEQDENTRTITFKAVQETEEDLTKTSIDLGSGVASWDAGDKLSVLCTDGTCVETQGAKLDGDAASFSADVTAEPRFLVYPSSVDATIVSDKLAVTIPAVQDGTFAGAAIGVAPYAGADKTSAIKNLGGLLQLNVSGDVDKIVIYNNGGAPLVGKVSVTFSSAGIPSIEVVDNDAANASSITIQGLDGSGEYYVAILPGSYSAGIYVELYSGDTLVGEKITGKTLTVARKQLRKLGTIASSVIANKKFVTVSGAGSKNGTNWDNALDAAGFYSLITTAAIAGQSVFMAAGTYETPELSAAAKTADGPTVSSSAIGFNVYGGYPSTPSGSSLAGRDIVNNHTILSGHEATRIFTFNGAEIKGVFDAIEFQKAYRASSGTGAGTAIVVEKCSSLKFYNCRIEDNHGENSSVTNHGGGAVRAKAGTILFKGCTFDNNSSAAYGGVMKLLSGADVTIDNCVFSNNSAVKGGAIYVSAGSLNIVNGTVLHDNSTSDNGGAIYQSGGSIIINGSELHDNKTTGTESGKGGAICITGGTATIAEKTLIYSNTTKIDGGAIAVGGGEMTISGESELYENTSTKAGGAISLTLGTLNIAGSAVLHNNIATVDGGAIFVSGGFLNISDGAVFHHNLAATAGGAISIKASSEPEVNIANSSFYRNRAASSSGYCGGAIAINPKDDITVSATVSATDCLFYENMGHATEIEINRTNIDATKASTGGAFYLGPNATLKMDRCKIYKNLASQNGGAIRIKNNTAKLYMNRCFVYDNYVGKYAAGIKNSSGILAMFNCVVYQNVPKTSVSTAGSNIESSNTLLANTSVRVNTASPGILLSSTASSVMVNNIFKNNNAADKAAVSVASNKEISSYGHNLYSYWGGTVTYPTGVVEASDVKVTADIPTWNSSTKYLTISSLPEAFYNGSDIDYRATPAQVEAAIDFFDKENKTDFKAWLNSLSGNALAVDIRGLPRPTEKIWPGSYEGDVTQ